MNRLTFALVSTLLLLTSACVTHRSQLRVGSSDYELARHESAGGRVERYMLDVGSGGNASLRVHTEYDKQRPFLGFQLIELDNSAAKKHGLEAFSGLLVQGTYARSSAQQADIRPGDILLALGEQKTARLREAADVEAALEPGEKVVARVRRGEDELMLELTANVLDERISETDSVPLESAQSRKPYAGVTLRGIPAHWCERIYGQPRAAVVVASVEVGSPAWLAGLRGGDVIDAVDGMPVPPVAELAQAIAERGEAGQPMRFEVSRGDSQPFEARVDLHDYSGETNLVIPIVFSVHDGVYRDRWTIGPWGLVMGNRNTYVADATTRAVDTTNVFSALLGLLRVEASPDETMVRLLWFISFRT